MEGRWRAIGIAAVGLCVVGFLIWRHAGPQEVRDIRRRLDALAGEFNAGTTDGIGIVARAARVGDYFTPDVTVEFGKGSPPIQGRETLVGMATRLQPRTAAYVVELDDVNVQLREATRADVTLTLTIRRRSMGSGEESIDAREFSLELFNTDGDWRINRVLAVDTFR